ncbi:MAG TPA: restriction endonuclease [Candidatus Omnitrophota bacterium]|nr:restriction endonuclease [Candidatus Omnitrophota bacterium]
MKEINFWGIHGGKTGDADSLFIKRGCVALGWSKMGDLSELKADRDSFKVELTRVYPEKKPGAVPNNAGQLFRFVHEMKKGDFVIYPSKSDRQIHIGRVDGDYSYSPKLDANYPHSRLVKWIKTLPRTHFTQGALYEIGSAMSFFMVKNYVDEFRYSVEGKSAATSMAQDDEVAVSSDEIEQITCDFILKRLAQEVKGHPFAEFVGHLLNTMGYRTRISPEGPDGGVDIIAHKDELGFEPPIIKVQIKSSESNVGDPEVSALYGKVDSGSKEFGLFVTLGSFSSKANAFAKSKSNLRLIDGKELVTLILQHYDQFDSRYKGLLPLKKVYVPEAVGED